MHIPHVVLVDVRIFSGQNDEENVRNPHYVVEF